MSALSSLVTAFRSAVRIAPVCRARFIKQPCIYQNVVNNPFCTAPKTTTINDKLLEFFDEKKNWGESEIQVGRSWRKDELRIKSNTDLHKLWYILLKERNMLLTMEEECKTEFKLFPNPERIDKVEESMQNLETVVRERNKAYHLLEIGNTGECEGKVVRSQIGLKFYYRFREYSIPKQMNKKWHKTHIHRYEGAAVPKFLKFCREKLYNENRKKKNRDRNHVMQLIKRFPNMDMDKLQAAYPNINVERAKSSYRARGHFIPKEFQ